MIRSAAPTPDTSITVLCVDDHGIVLEGVALLIDAQPDMRTVGKATNGHDAIELYKKRRPCITLMDLQLGTFTGVDTIRAIRRIDQTAKIVALTTYQGDEDIHRALQAGAATYILKESIPDDLLQCIRNASRGGSQLLAPGIQAKLEERTHCRSLSRREQEVLELLGGGMRNKEIAAFLGISDATAYGHVKRIMLKLGIRHRTAAIAVAIRRGLLHLG